MGITCCSLAICVIFPRNSLVESDYFMILEVFQLASTSPSWYVPAFCKWSTPEYASYVESPQYKHAVCARLVQSPKLIESFESRLVAFSLNTPSVPTLTL